MEHRTHPRHCLELKKKKKKKNQEPERCACEMCLCQLLALRRIYEPHPDPHLSRAPGEHSRPRFISVRGAVWETRSRRWRKLVPASDVTINQAHVSDAGCHICSSVIYPHHHRAAAPNLSADTLVRLSSLEKSFGLTIGSTLNWEKGSNDVDFPL